MRTNTVVFSNFVHFLLERLYWALPRAIFQKLALCSQMQVEAYINFHSIFDSESLIFSFLKLICVCVCVCVCGTGAWTQDLHLQPLHQPFLCVDVCMMGFSR
jgi:hypothetical protein